MSQERRQHPRVVVTCPAKVFDGKRRLLLRGKTVDISAGGVKILGPTIKEAQPGTRVAVEVDLTLPNVPRRLVTREATVRRVEPMGEWAALALQFDKPIEI